MKSLKVLSLIGLIYSFLFWVFYKLNVEVDYLFDLLEDLLVIAIGVLAIIYAQEFNKLPRTKNQIKVEASSVIKTMAIIAFCLVLIWWVINNDSVDESIKDPIGTVIAVYYWIFFLAVFINCNKLEKIDKESQNKSTPPYNH